MDFIKSEIDKEFHSIGFKNQRKNLKYKAHQVGRTNKKRDESRKALLNGKRISKNGKIYYEYRKNRGDLRGSNL